MKRAWSLLALVVLAVVLLAAPALAQSCSIGGHNETSENFAPGAWAITLPTPGAVAGPPSASHLLISEAAPQGISATSGSDSSEYVEIYNPTAMEVSLDNVYLGDDNLYYRIVNGPYNVANATDFVVRFPQGLRLGPGRTALVCVTKQGYAASGGTPARPSTSSR